ncbi:MAG: protein O-mannosyl-transferase family [Chloroflexota bacterium]
MEINGARAQSLISNLQSLLLVAIPLLYLSTLARSLVLGDPTEYTLVAHVLGIAHPPGYAFFTLLGKLFQTLIPFGSIPWRMHALAAFSATVAALMVYATLRTVQRREHAGRWPMLAIAGALFAALTLATAADVWQHAIHANPHIVTATFLVANLFFLTRWWSQQGPERSDRWLYVFCLSAGLGVTHHPLTVISFPAYAIFILLVRPQIVREGRTLLKMIGWALLGLSVWLYFPVRSAMEPVFGPHDMNTVQGFRDHVLARGLTESLPFFGPRDQPMRALVFWSLLRLQYSLTTLVVALLGLVWLYRQRSRRSLFVLFSLAFLFNYAFVINLRAQDVMAYALGLFMLVALFAGAGLYALLALVWRRARPGAAALGLLLAALFLMGPALQLARNLPHISLRQYDEGRAHVEAVFDYFENSGDGVVLLHDWEHMTPMWYARFVENRWPDPQDVRPEFVSTQQPWVESVFAYLGGGPVYVNSYRPEIVSAGFRLRPRGPFYQVVEPEESSVPPELTPAPPDATGGEIELAAYSLPETEVTAGQILSLTLAMRAEETPEQVYVPSLQLGAGSEAIDFTFTTDHHLLSTLWQPGEVIVERFDLPLPHDLAPGSYPLALRLKNLSTDQFTELELPLGAVQVAAQANPPSTTGLLANFRQRVGLAGAWAGHGLDWRSGEWEEPLVVGQGESFQLILQWQSLARAEESYTVFVHLIDESNRPWVTLDYTPLGGSAPTHLWIPKWLPGQRLLDPYRVPADLPPGRYYVEVGLYEMTGGRRLHRADAQGNLAGDRIILGPVQVTE